MSLIAPTLLGAAQILLDGGKLVFERSAPDAAILQSLWTLLPTRERGELWPASFTFSNVHQFDAVVVPRANEAEYERYITEEKAGDYPEGRYECNLQSAIETGDQREIDALLNYSRSRMLRLIVAALPDGDVAQRGHDRVAPAIAVDPTAAVHLESNSSSLQLPAENNVRHWIFTKERRSPNRLQTLGKQWHIGYTAGKHRRKHGAALTVLDKQLGTPDAERDPGRS